MSGKVTAPYEDLTYRIIGIAMKVHRSIGPGEREEIYQRALELAFTEDGLSYESQKNIEVYEESRLIGLYIPDFIVEDKIILEIKAFSTLHVKYLGQVITYLNHTGLPVGLLVNFGESSLRHRRVFPSPHATDRENTYRWLFVPKWLADQKQEDPID